MYPFPPPRTRWYRRSQAIGVATLATAVTVGPLSFLMLALATDLTGDAAVQGERAIQLCLWNLLASGCGFLLGLLLVCGAARTRRATVRLASAAAVALVAMPALVVAAYLVGAA